MGTGLAISRRLNLIINARDAMPDGGSVTLSARNLLDNEHVAVAVEDTGVGIPQDVADRVFDPFFTTEPLGKGTGLGLSQVHGFAHQAGGSVAIDSEVGRGTKVTLNFASRDAGPTDQSEEKLALTSNGTVLLVEDNPEVANASTGLLEALGYRVRWAADAHAALDALEHNGIDIVFSDIVMPGKMDGVGLACTIRDTYPGVPVLLVTGYASSAQEISGQFPLVRKPYQLHELSRELEKLKAE